MNNYRITEALTAGKAVVPFITCGDPDLDTTAAVIRAAEEAGAAAVALSLPFSDPMAEGVLVQESGLRALSGGMTTDKAFEFMAALRADGIKIPVVFVTYGNVVFSYGTDRFVSCCREAEVSGVLIQDIPYEEMDDFLPDCRRHGVALISQLAMTSGERVEMIASEAEGFISLSITPKEAGSNSEEKISALVERVHACTDIPCIISCPCADVYQAARLCALSDGIMDTECGIGALAQFGKAAAAPVGAYVGSIRKNLG